EHGRFLQTVSVLASGGEHGLRLGAGAVRARRQLVWLDAGTGSRQFDSRNQEQAFSQLLEARGTWPTCLEPVGLEAGPFVLRPDEDQVALSSSALFDSSAVGKREGTDAARDANSCPESTQNSALEFAGSNRCCRGREMAYLGFDLGMGNV